MLAQECLRRRGDIMCDSENSSHKGKSGLAEAILTSAKVLLYLIFGVALIGYLAPEVLIGLGLAFSWPHSSWIWIGVAALVVSSLIDQI